MYPREEVKAVDVMAATRCLPKRLTAARKHLTSLLTACAVAAALFWVLGGKRLTVVGGSSSSLCCLCASVLL